MPTSIIDSAMEATFGKPPAAMDAGLAAMRATFGPTQYDRVADAMARTFGQAEPPRPQRSPAAPPRPAPPQFDDDDDMNLPADLVPQPLTLAELGVVVDKEPPPDEPDEPDEPEPDRAPRRAVRPMRQRFEQYQATQYAANAAAPPAPTVINVDVDMTPIASALVPLVTALAALADAMTATATTAKPRPPIKITHDDGSASFVEEVCP